MSGGCEGCFTSNRGQQEQLEAVRVKAKELAKTNEKAVAIYREGYELLYCFAEIAISNKYNTIEVVSQYN
jgi:hypothetical protein